MRIGIIQTGVLSEAVATEHGQYPALYEAMLQSGGAKVACFTVDLTGGADLPAPESADGWLVTGSRHGTYDDLPWMGPLRAFLRAALDAGMPVIGICFGHQILADALGGASGKHPGGWELGPRSYRMEAQPGWAAGLGPAITAHAVHQDQVRAIPEGATVLASAPGCAYAALAYGDPEAPLAVSFQSHPEFSDGLVEALIETRLTRVVPSAEIDAARAAMGQPLSNTAMAEALARFLEIATKRRGAG